MVNKMMKHTNRTNIAAMGNSITAEVIEGKSRLWQSEAFTKWIGLEDHRMTVKAATGAGKTYLAVMIMHWWRNLHGKNAKVVFGVPTKDLVVQTADVFRGWRFNFARVCSGYNEAHLNKDVYITTYMSLEKVKKNKHLKGKKILIIGDECHKMGADKTRIQFINFQGDACLLLSATPERDDEIDVSALMNAPQLVDLKLIDGIQQSRRGEDTLDFTLHYVMVQPTPAETTQLYEIEEEVRIAYHAAKSAVDKAGGNVGNLMSFQNKNLGDAGAASALQSYKYKTMLRKRIENDIEARYDVVQAIMNKHIGDKMACFHESIFGIERLNQMCMNEGIQPRVYHSGMELSPEQALAYPELNTPQFHKRLKDYSKNAKRELQRWKESASDYLLTCKSLKEGFDVPDMDGLIMMTGTNSVRSRIQTIGRVFRGSKHKDIYMLVLQGVGENGSGDHRSFWRLVEKTGIKHSNIKYTTLAMLNAGVGSVGDGEQSEYISHPAEDDLTEDDL
jgi:superfamily II DNA or RNA helicase